MGDGLPRGPRGGPQLSPEWKEAPTPGSRSCPCPGSLQTQHLPPLVTGHYYFWYAL